MFHATQPTRRSFLRRSAMALAALAPVGSRLTQESLASKNDHRRPSAVKANRFIAECFKDGGEPEVGNVTDTKAEVTCTSDDGSWFSCTFTDKAPNYCRGGVNSHPLVSPLWELSPITMATDPGALTNGEANEITFTLTFASPGDRKRRKRHGSKH